MENSRLEIHEILKKIIGSCNVYYQPPSSKKMNYPCIVYSLADISKKNANNKTYNSFYMYTVTYISYEPDENISDKILKLKYSTFERFFATQGLNHYVFTLYYKNEKRRLKENG